MRTFPSLVDGNLLTKIAFDLFSATRIRSIRTLRSCLWNILSFPHFGVDSRFAFYSFCLITLLGIFYGNIVIAIFWKACDIFMPFLLPARTHRTAHGACVYIYVTLCHLIPLPLMCLSSLTLRVDNSVWYMYRPSSFAIDRREEGKNASYIKCLYLIKHAICFTLEISFHFFSSFS